MKALFALLPLGVALAACSVSVNQDDKTGEVKDIHISLAGSGIKVSGDGNVKSETRPVTATISRIELSAPVNVDIAVGEANTSLVVSGDSNIIPMVKTTQHDDVLVISMDNASFKTHHSLEVKLTLPTLLSATSTGAGDLKVHGLNGSDFNYESHGSGDLEIAGRVGNLNLNLNGSGDVDASHLQPGNVNLSTFGSGNTEFGEIHVDHFNAVIHGSGDVSASGTTKDVKGDVTGSGNLSLSKLKSENAIVALVGSGDISIYASKSISGSAVGSGDIVVHGRPASNNLTGKHRQADDKGKNHDEDEDSDS